jgi:hypothetical protein
MPAVQDGTAFASVLPETHGMWRRHTFNGGNFMLQRVLGRYGPELLTQVDSREFAAGIGRTLDFLAQRTAGLSVRVVEFAPDQLRVQVLVSNATGHKLPTAYPSRRVWVHFVVRDKAGGAVFESGQVGPSGLIYGNDNDRDGLSYEPHYTEINSTEQVQIYESIMADSQGRVTTGLLIGVRYVKDNRLLPLGFERRTASDDIAVKGHAAQDPDFIGGSDRINYVVAVDQTRGPFVIEAELCYQPVGYRWAHNLEGYRASEPQRFVRYYNALAQASSTVLARASTVTPR